MTMTTIDSFRGDYAFLSNFHPCPVRLDGTTTYTSAEHAYAAAKAATPAEAERIAQAPTPGKAKRLGRQVPLRRDWEQVKISVMKRVLWAKFTQNTDLAKLLIATGEAYLVEGNHWNDRFWGVSNGDGENWLGRILMMCREHLGGSPRLCGATNGDGEVCGCTQYPIPSGLTCEAGHGGAPSVRG